MPTFLDIDVAQPEGFRPLSIDLRTPDVAGAPLVLFLHGGGWLRGSRKVFTPGIGDADSFDRIVAAGFAVASCEYRLSGEARFPAPLDDVDAAISWLREHGADYGVDAERMVMWGVSAGATIAALVALRRGDLCGVIDWFGPTDLLAMAEIDTGEPPSQTREALWLGAPAGEVPDAARRASPVHQVHRDAPPFHIAHGTADEHVPLSQGRALAAALEGVDADVEFRVVEGGKHFWQGVADTGALFDDALAFVARVV